MTTPPPSPPDHYAVLGVPDTAPHGVVRDAYRRTMRRTHPDVAASDPTAAERAVAANVAWAVLRDPVRRAAYDRTRARLRSPARTDAGAPGDAPGGPGGLPPVTAAQLREAAARSSAFGEAGRATRRAYAAASLRMGIGVILLGVVLLSLFLRG